MTILLSICLGAYALSATLIAVSACVLAGRRARDLEDHHEPRL